MGLLMPELAKQFYLRLAFLFLSISVYPNVVLSIFTFIVLRMTQFFCYLLEFLCSKS